MYIHRYWTNIFYTLVFIIGSLHRLVLNYFQLAIGVVLFPRPGNPKHMLELEFGFCSVLRGNLIIRTEDAGYYALMQAVCTHAEKSHI